MSTYCTEKREIKTARERERQKQFLYYTYLNYIFILRTFNVHLLELIKTHGTLYSF